jgi:hypothetical protein
MFKDGTRIEADCGFYAVAGPLVGDHECLGPSSTNGMASSCRSTDGSGPSGVFAFWAPCASHVFPADPPAVPRLGIGRLHNAPLTEL